jgi:hypothetical protein
VGDSIIVALPLGDGTKIRGQRANIIIADEFASIPKDIFETVVRGFAAVARPGREVPGGDAQGGPQGAGPVDRRPRGARGRRLVQPDRHLGTAYYAFNHFYDYWKQYKAIVESRGDPRKLEESSGQGPPSSTGRTTRSSGCR